MMYANNTTFAITAADAPEYVAFPAPRSTPNIKEHATTSHGCRGGWAKYITVEKEKEVRHTFEDGVEE
jgi:hypothetical protein